MINPNTIHNKVVLAFTKLPVKVTRHQMEHSLIFKGASGAVYFSYKGVDLRFDYSYSTIGGRKDIPKVGNIRSEVWENIDATVLRLSLPV